MGATERCRESARRKWEERFGEAARKSLKVHKLCRGMSLVRSELPQWSVKYWRNNLHSRQPRNGIALRSFPSPLFADLGDISLFVMLFGDVGGIVTRAGSRDKFDIDRKTRAAPDSLGDGFGDIRGSRDEENFSLTGRLAADFQRRRDFATC